MEIDSFRHKKGAFDVFQQWLIPVGGIYVGFSSFYDREIDEVTMESATMPTSLLCPVGSVGSVGSAGAKGIQGFPGSGCRSPLVVLGVSPIIVGMGCVQQW